MNRTGLKPSPCGTPMLVLVFSPVVFPHLTFSLMSLISMYSMCSSFLVVHQTIISSGLCQMLYSYPALVDVFRSFLCYCLFSQ